MPSSKSRGASLPPDQPPALAVVGPTASGKSAWALQLAEQLEAEIVSADSRQLYRRLDIGTAKPSAAERARIPHHCLDIRDPAEPISLAEYLLEARASIAAIRSRDRLPIIVGGSGQYVWALLEGWQVPPVPPDRAFRARMARAAEACGAATLHRRLAAVDPEAAARIDSRNLRRIIRALEVQQASGRSIWSWRSRREPLPFIAVGPARAQETLDRRIAERSAAMFNAGLLEEVAALLRAGVAVDAPGFDAIGYREALAHIRGKLPLLDAAAAVATATQRFSRRQRAWFRPADPRIHWSAQPPAPAWIKAQIQAHG